MTAGAMPIICRRCDNTGTVSEEGGHLVVTAGFKLVRAVATCVPCNRPAGIRYAQLTRARLEYA